MTASDGLGTQIVIAFDIGFGLKAQDQGLRRVYIRAASYLAVHQPMKQVQHMGFGCNAFG
jgi:hypothetical protein